LWEWLTSGHSILNDLPVLGLRTLIGFVALLTVMRLTGKRTVTQLAPFDFAMVIMIGEVAAIPIADGEVDIFHGVIPILIIGTLHVLLSKLNLHYRKFEDLTEGKATLLIKDGMVLKENLVKERVSSRDLRAALRLKEVRRLDEIKEARLEHSGGISIIKREDAVPLTPRDGLPEPMRTELDRLLAAHMDRLRAEILAELKAKETPRGDHAPLH
jgi:uncharacterized membrane protein YcaP (DUF421 family)